MANCNSTYCPIGVSINIIIRNNRSYLKPMRDSEGYFEIIKMPAYNTLVSILIHSLLLLYLVHYIIFMVSSVKKYYLSNINSELLTSFYLPNSRYPCRLRTMPSLLRYRNKGEFKKVRCHCFFHIPRYSEIFQQIHAT